MSILKAFGWNNYFENNFLQYKEQGFNCGRVIVENKTNYILITEFGEVPAEVTGKLIFESDSGSSMPKVGDWVTLSLFDDNTKGIIHNVLPRSTKISRRAVDKKVTEQIIVSNVDAAFIVMSLDGNYNLNRLERYLASVLESNIDPIVLLTKSDMCVDADDKYTEVKNLAREIKVISSSMINKTGIDELTELIRPEITYVFVGSSGVGKSTIINFLLGEDRFKTNEVRISDSKGRHTTTKRELVLLPNGGVLVDTPGMKQFGMWEASGGVAKTFSYFEEYAESCRYTDCTHTHEVDCAVKEAVNTGMISEERYNNYLKLRKELNYVERQNNIAKQLEEKRKWKTIIKEYKSFVKKRGYE